MQYEQLIVPFDRLIYDAAANVRKKYNPETIAEMKASILAKGIIQPIAARPPKASDADLGGQLYRIFAGGRRYRAMSELVAEKKIGPDYAVPIIVRDVDEAGAQEMSLAENIVREQMTPADEFRAFNALVEKGATVEDIALRFGQTERYVRGRLALARLHPDILAAFEQDKLSYSAACAYTVQPDIEVQFRHFSEVGNYYRNDPWNIKDAMRKVSIRADSRLATLIGEEAYVAAGGVVQEDLFGEDAFWISIDLIGKLKAGAIDLHRSNALADGWSFFATTEELGVDLWSLKQAQPEGDGITEAEGSRMDEIAEDLEGCADDDESPEIVAMREEYDRLEAKESTYTAEQKAVTGVAFDLNNLQFKVGVYRPHAVAGHVGEPLAAASKANEAAKKDPLALTQPLKDQVGEAASDALSAGMLANPHKALALVTAMLATADVYTTGVGRPSRIKVEQMGHGGTDDKKLSIVKLLGQFAALTQEELVMRLAGFAAQTVDLTEAWFQKDYTQDDVRAKTRTAFLEVFFADPVASFDAEAWFAACTKPMIDAAMNEMTGRASGKPKKADMAREAAAEATARGWLPKELRLKGYALKKEESEKKTSRSKATKKKDALASAI